MLQNIVHARVVMEQAVAVDAVQAALFQLHRGRHKAVSADDFQVFFIPQNQMQIVVVVTVNVATFAAAFAHRAEGDFPQAAQFAQHRRIFLAAALPEINHFAIRRAPQRFRPAQFALEQGAVFGSGDSAFAFKYAGLPFCQQLQVAIAAFGQLANRALRIEPA